MQETLQYLECNIFTPPIFKIFEKEVPISALFLKYFYFQVMRVSVVVDDHYVFHRVPKQRKFFEKVLVPRVINRLKIIYKSPHVSFRVEFNPLGVLIDSYLSLDKDDNTS